MRGKWQRGRDGKWAFVRLDSISARVALNTILRRVEVRSRANAEDIKIAKYLVCVIKAEESGGNVAIKKGAPK